MRINFHNYIPFRKKLVANCCIKNKEQSEQCKIYKLDKKTDKKYFSNLSKNKDWNYNHFVDVIDGEFKYGIMPDEFYVLESQDEACCDSVGSTMDWGLCILRLYGAGRNYYSG